MVSMDNFDERQFARCPRCNGVVAKTELLVDGVCRACKTMYKKTSWEATEERRMEKAERESQKVRVVCPACGRENILTEDKKRCSCGYSLRKRMSEE